jgi:hypothetical protein
MIDHSLPVVPAKAGTHTAESIDRFDMAVALHNNILWLWVPAFAGTTVTP